MKTKATKKPVKKSAKKSAKKPTKKPTRTKPVVVTNTDGRKIRLGRTWAVQEEDSALFHKFQIKRSELKAELPLGYVQLYAKGNAYVLLGKGYFQTVRVLDRTVASVLHIGCNAFYDADRRKFLAWARGTPKAKAAAAGKSR